MGLSFSGGSNQSQSSQSNNVTKTFSGGQTSLQDQLGKSLSSSLSEADQGGLTPGVQAQKTAAADDINTTSNGLTDRVNRFLAQRGFGSSGETGKVSLQGELQRQSDLVKNSANFAGVQQGVNSQNLLAALNFALTNLGISGTSSGSSSGSNFGWGASGSAAFGF